MYPVVHAHLDSFPASSRSFPSTPFDEGLLVTGVPSTISLRKTWLQAQCLFLNLRSRARGGGSPLSRCFCGSPIQREVDLFFFYMPLRKFSLSSLIFEFSLLARSRPFSFLGLLLLLGPSFSSHIFRQAKTTNLPQKEHACLGSYSLFPDFPSLCLRLSPFGTPIEFLRLAT